MKNDTQIKYFTESRPELLKYIPESVSKMLDIGCSSGNFSALVKAKYNPEIWGIELNKEAADAAKNKLDKVLVGDLHQYIKSLPEKYFDCIVFNDVLEHLTDPWSVLETLKINLTENGLIIASIPNVLEIYNLYNLIIKQDWEYKDMGILDKTHLRFFTKKSIIRMFQKCNYIVTKIEGINENKSWKWRLFNIVTFGFLYNTRYLQFACIVKVK